MSHINGLTSQVTVGQTLVAVKHMYPYNGKEKKGDVHNKTGDGDCVHIIQFNPGLGVIAGNVHLSSE